MYLEQIAVIVDDYDEALQFFVEQLGLFLRVDDFPTAYERMRRNRVEFVTEPRTEDYGQVAVFLDVSGNRWDLLGPPPA